MLKSVEEIKNAKDQLDDVTCEGDQDSVNAFVFDALIGIAEHLEGKSTHDRLNEILVVESSKVSNTCQQIIREIEKIKEHMPPVENYEEGNYLKDWVREVQLAERHGIRKGIEWCRDHPEEDFDAAISRIKNGGPL